MVYLALDKYKEELGALLPFLLVKSVSNAKAEQREKAEAEKRATITIHTTPRTDRRFMNE